MPVLQGAGGRWWVQRLASQGIHQEMAPRFLSLVESLKELEGSPFVVPLPGCSAEPPESLLKIPIPGV